MGPLLDELTAGFPDMPQLLRVAIRLMAATVLGAVIGIEREREGKFAGFRTHMLVALASALFVLAPLEAGFAPERLSQIIQGVAAGIGFIGGGAILKMSSEREILGLTTAASIWMTAAVGVAVGLGRIALAAFTVALTWIILTIMQRVERRLAKKRP